MVSIEMNLKEQGRREKPLTFMWMNLIGRGKLKTVLSDFSSRLPPRDLAFILKNSVRNI
nr:hypothetical protein [Candidatus Baldrarchaeota archaeon]